MQFKKFEIGFSNTLILKFVPVIQYIQNSHPSYGKLPHTHDDCHAVWQQVTFIL